MEPEKRIREFLNLGYGMFIHWGLYSQLGQGEWAMEMQGIPKSTYSSLFDSFTAADFDAEKIVSLAQRAGMKYITFTTRHHEGFSLYDTKGLSDFDSVHSPAHRDLVRELVEACNKKGILPMLYHTTLDWYQESFNADFETYLAYLRDSVEILCTEYGKIGGFWFDGNWSRPDADWEEDALYGMIRKHQPQAIIINNTGIGHEGQLGHKELDSVTFEQSKPTLLNQNPRHKFVASEMCQTMNDHWGLARCDYQYKSVPELIKSLCDSRKMGSNYLLNIGLTEQGGILKLQEAMLETVGEWIHVCGESIYKGKPTSVRCKNRDFVLADDKNLYIYVYDLPISGHQNVTVGHFEGSIMRTYSKVSGRVKRIEWVDNHQPICFEQNGDSLTCYFTGFPYGRHTVVRVAAVELEKDTESK